MASKHKWRKTIYGPFVARYRCPHCDAVKIVETPGNYRPDNTHENLPVYAPHRSRDWINLELYLDERVRLTPDPERYTPCRRWA